MLDFIYSVFSNVLALIVIVIVGFILLRIIFKQFKAQPHANSEETVILSNLNKKYEDSVTAFNEFILEPEEREEYQKKLKKEQKAKLKAAKNKTLDKNNKEVVENRLFVLHFKGDLHASAKTNLSKQIDLIIQVANPNDQVLLNLNSPGGTVTGYGYAASQLNRIKEANLKLTVVVDEVAASGGYMMACVADKIVAGPFSYIGSIGVVAQIPNFYRFLKDKKIDVETITAGKYKRTVTPLSEITPEALKKDKTTLEEIHGLFKKHISKYRPNLDIEKIATGEVWLGSEALELGLIDQLGTSQDLILAAIKEDVKVYELTHKPKKTLLNKIGAQSEASIKNLVEHFITNQPPRV